MEIIPLPVTSAIISIVGTLANSTSLIYFLKKGERKIGDKLLMLLNCIDLALCTLAASLAIYLSTIMSEGEAVDSKYFAIVLYLYLHLVDGTAYTTCLLSVTRAISITFPFYKIRGKPLVIVGIAVYVIMQLTSALVPTFINGKRVDFNNSNFGTSLTKVRFLKTLLSMLVVFCATFVSVYKLTRKDIPEGTEGAARNNKKATWTVVILSTLFIVFNVAFLAATADVYKDPLAAAEEKSPLLLSAYVGMFMAIPLNSAINPTVYLVRIEEMRQFFLQNFQKIRQNSLFH